MLLDGRWKFLTVIGHRCLEKALGTGRKATLKKWERELHRKMLRSLGRQEIN